MKVKVTYVKTYEEVVELKDAPEADEYVKQVMDEEKYSEEGLLALEEKLLDYFDLESSYDLIRVDDMAGKTLIEW